MRHLGVKAAILAATSVISFNSAANAAVTFNLLTADGQPLAAEAQQGFELAASYWSSVLTNDVTVNLQIGYTDLGNPNVLGQTGSSRADVTLNDVVGGMMSTGNSALDATALSNLTPMISGGAISAITNTALDPITGNGINTDFVEWDNDPAGPASNNSTIYGNTSVLKALGLSTDIYGDDFSNVLDGQITFNSVFNWDFNPTDGIGVGQYDFIGVAIHEIGHALGFVSGVDLYDLYGAPNGPYAVDGLGINFDEIGGLASTLDLFRYSEDVMDVAPGGDPVLDWSVGSDAYFSIDGGATELFGDSAFSTGRYNGDGQQASHWKASGSCGGFLGILNPYLCSGTVAEISALDLASYDAMGWNLNLDILENSDYLFTTADVYNAAIPEVGTWFMMIAGLGFAGGALRRRNSGAVSFA